MAELALIGKVVLVGELLNMLLLAEDLKLQGSGIFLDKL